jgi:transposase
MDAPPPGHQEDMAAELKRLRRDNEVLRQERESLKRAATSLAKEGSRSLRVSTRYRPGAQ